MSESNPEQIERHFHYHGAHGGGNRNRHATYLKKMKVRAERRKGKQFKEETSTEFDGEKYVDYTETVAEADTYGKYLGWEY